MISRKVAAVLLGLGLSVVAPALAQQNPLRPPRSSEPQSPAMEPRGGAATAPRVTLRLGELLPLTGPSSWYGEEMRHGLELAVADLAPPPPRPTRPAAVTTSPPATDVQTTLVPPGGATDVDFGIEVPGTYTLVDHAVFRLQQGAVGYLKVEGKEDTTIFTGDPSKFCPGCEVHP